MSHLTVRKTSVNCLKLVWRLRTSSISKREFWSDIHHATLDCMIYVMEMCNYIHGCTLYASSASDIQIEISYTTFPHTITKGLVAIYINIFKCGVSNANHRSNRNVYVVNVSNGKRKYMTLLNAVFGLSNNIKNQCLFNAW